MLKRTLHELPEHLYPADEWRLVERGYSPRYCSRAETFFALANGYVGVRGTYDEGRPSTAPGTYVNGFHETWPIVHAEEAYGFARFGQTIVKVPDATILRLLVDDEPLSVPEARLHGYARVLDMRAGTLTREMSWSTPGGKHVELRSRRVVSLEHRHVLAVEYEVTMRGHAAPVVLRSQVLNLEDLSVEEASERPPDPRAGRDLADRVLNPVVVAHEGGRILLGYRTTNSGMTLGVGVDHVISTANPHTTDVAADGDRGEVVLTVDAQPGVPIRVTKFVTYQTSRGAPPEELTERCSRTLDRSVRDGFGALLDGQRAHLDRFWDRADVRVSQGAGTARLQQAVRWNLFQLAQATWRAEGAGVPAKGLTGNGYEGHYFWDIEVYLLPFLAYTQPRIARNLLRFRHSMLPAARERARELGQRGALFAWRTIDGREASAYYAAGTAQYHLNADIAFAIRRYVHARGDTGFLLEAGAEVLVETARMWADLGFHGDDGAFHIHGVTGPDEYTTVVNDNTYTNLMARLNLRYAAETMRALERERPAEHAALAAELGLHPGELDEWERAADAMHVPFDEERGIHPQDAHFLEREVWDLDATPPERFPLLLHHHPLEIYRRQVIKQADIVLAMYLVGDEFTAAHKRADFEYYDRLTTGDSSLSACVQSIIAAEVGDERRALDYFRFALMIDLGDVAGNVSDGVHIAAAGGVWQALVCGFGGVRDHDGELTFDPRLPRAWSSLAYSLRYRARQLRVALGHDEERYLLEDGGPVEVTIRDERRRLVPGQPLVVRPPGR
ncbi:glycoside hydrolase family 65 protein [Miltoncostaea marina]|uniref:glycoside hydrolase family 65 protein n=1 Tax=Miltoncostaea marina TaxID=2843215 RepID=UPI001C3C762B|nr:glycosyl hydrolase family 65 protein [Miltoncostaea marina]